MPPSSSLASQVHIKLAGVDAPADVMGKLASVTVDQNVHLPPMFTIRLNDTGLEVLNNGPFDLTKEIEISAESEDGQQTVLVKGEITALEPDFKEGMIAELVVRGFDHSHRLFRETRTKAYLNVKDSDVATQIAQAANLQTEVETTRTVYDNLFQHNQTDLDFLMQRAWRIGYECLFRMESCISASRRPEGPGERA